MIRGRVDDRCEAIIRLTVVGQQGRRQHIDAVVDTGYDGCLTLPDEIIAALRLEWRRRGKAELADGREINFNVYEGSLIWDNNQRRIEIEHAETNPLLGMELMAGHRLTMEVVSGGPVIIEHLDG